MIQAKSELKVVIAGFQAGIQSIRKYWQELPGQVGGRVRPPMLELTDQESEVIRTACAGFGLKM